MSTNLVAHWDGSAWSSVDSNDPDSMLYDVAAVSAADAWTVGWYSNPHGGSVSARVLHWDGVAWAPYPAPKGGTFGSLYSISADSATDIWAGGLWEDRQGSIHPLGLHYDGTAWRQTTTASPTGSDVFQSVYAIATDDVWAVGYSTLPGFYLQSLVEHWDGSTWSVVPTPDLGQDSTLSGVSGAATDDVWAVGGFGTGEPPTLLHWDGVAWSVVDAEGQPGRIIGFIDIQAISSDDVWAVGQSTDENGYDLRPAAEHWDGSSWTITNVLSLGTPGPLRGIGASSSTDVWAVGFFYDAGNYSRPLAEHSRGLCPGQ